MKMVNIKKTALNHIHRALGGNMVEFAGWDMPIWYTSIIDEHMAVRNSVGIFDVSHMGDITIKGKGTMDFLSKIFTNDPRRCAVGDMRYTHLCNEKGQVMDDMIMYKYADDHFFVVPNGATADMVWAWFQKHAKGFKVEMKNTTVDWYCIAVQGPHGFETVQKLTKEDLSPMKFFSFREVDLGVGDKVMTCRSGYTGEDGFELVGPNKFAEPLWKKLMAAGKEFGIKPIGLGARDTLRLEKGFLLSGSDFHNDRTPLECGVGWAVKLDHDFIGKGPIEKQKQKDDYGRFRGFICTEPGIPRHGCKIEVNGKEIGPVTSGTMSPVLKKGIALGFVPKQYMAAGTKVDIIVRDKKIKAEIHDFPMVPDNKK
jgi:aminomethyltransferase